MLSNKKNRRDKIAEIEKSQILNPERLAEEKKQRHKQILLWTAGTVIAVAALAYTSFWIVSAIGRANLRSSVMAAPKIENAPIEAEVMPTKEEAVEWQEGWVKYKNQIYAYNEDILTFLIMGIDKTKNVKEVAEGTDGGQADALFLVVLNPHDDRLSVIGINRNTMTEIAIYDENGAFIKNIDAQIAVQHGFGNGVEESCEYQVKAVRHLFYEIPIHGYAAINMDAVVTLTDMMDGIDLTALEDVRNVKGKNKNVIIHQGEEVHLDGEKAYAYVRYRDVTEFASADHRLDRQKQFITAYIKKAKEKTKENIGFPVEVYQQVASQVTTDVSVDELTYLVSVAKNYSFHDDAFYSMQGETVKGEQFEEFYADEKQLFEMILEVFYEPVNS